jgi:hypothetical protein
MLAWNPNQERDLAGYRVYVGKQSRVYETVHSAGLQTHFSLAGLPAGDTYYLAVTAYDLHGNESDFSEEVSVTIPKEEGNPDDGGLPPSAKPRGESSLALVYNFPNPFNPETQSTTLRYFLSTPQDVTIRIYDLKGDLVHQPVFRQSQNAGEHTDVQWDGRNSRGEKVASGVYYCEISTGEQTVAFPIAVIRR